MPLFRLAYPATICASVEGPDLDAAKQKLVDALTEVQGGMIVTIEIAQEKPVDEILYPNVDIYGDVAVGLIELEDNEV